VVLSNGRSFSRHLVQ